MPRGNGYRTVLSSTAIAGIMTLGPWAALPAAAAPTGHPKAAHPQPGNATPSDATPSSATSDGRGDALVPMFGLGKPTITLEPQPGTFPADSLPDLNGLTLDVDDATTDTSVGSCTLVAAGPGPANCSVVPAPVNDTLSVSLDPGTPPPDGFLAPAPVSFTIPDCDPSGQGVTVCPDGVTVELPGTWRPVGLKVTNAATGDPVQGAQYLLCEPAASSSADCPAGTADVASATSGADGTLQFPGLYQGSPDYQVVAKSVPHGFVQPGPQALDVPAITTPAEAGTPFTGTVTLTPKAPVAQDDTTTLPEDTSRRIDVLANDSTPVGGLTVQHAGSPTHGRVTVGSNGVLTYTPAVGFVGTDRFGYDTVNDYGASAHAMVSITVSDVPPTLAPVQLDTNENSAVSFDALRRATAAKGNIVHVSAVGTPQHGTAKIGRDGTVTYTPDHDYVGPDSFTYTVADDHGGTATAGVTVTVTGATPTASPSPTTTAPSSEATPSPTATEPPLADTGASDLPGLLGLGGLLVALGSLLVGWTLRRPSRHRL